eukprot:1209369-Ditylum_brightwellii.AAC.1
MEYVLGQSFFSKYGLDNIGQKALRAFTAKCGYNRNMPYAMCNGSSHLGGYEFTPLYHLQGRSLIPKTPPNSSGMDAVSIWHVRAYTMGHNLCTASSRS